MTAAIHVIEGPSMLQTLPSSRRMDRTMDKELIAKLAYRCGFQPFNGTQLHSEDRPGLICNYEADVSEEMYRFASLVAEECAKTAENVLVPFAHDDGETRAAVAIREQFKP